VGGTDAGAASVRKPEATRKRSGTRVCGAGDGAEPCAGNAPDLGSCRHRPCQGSSVPAQKVAKRYTKADVELLAYVDKSHGNLSGPATKRILEREHSEYTQSVYERLAGISVAQLYRFRNSEGYRKKNTTYQPTRPIPIGERRKPRPHARPGYLRIDTVRQGDKGSGQVRTARPLSAATQPG